MSKVHFIHGFVRTEADRWVIKHTAGQLLYEYATDYVPDSELDLVAGDVRGHFGFVVRPSAFEGPLPNAAQMRALMIAEFGGDEEYVKDAIAFRAVERTTCGVRTRAIIMTCEVPLGA